MKKSMELVELLLNNLSKTYPSQIRQKAKINDLHLKMEFHRSSKTLLEFHKTLELEPKKGKNGYFD